MLLKKISFILLAGCTLLFAAAPEYIRLEGTVKDADGAAIEGADVYLKSDETSKVQTDAEGKFLIEIGTSIIPHSFSVKKPVEIAGRGACLNFSVSAPVAKGLVTIFAGNGRRVKDIELNNISAGLQTISLKDISNGFYIVQVTLDNTTTRRKLIAAGSEMIISEIKSENSSRSATLAKMAAAAEAVDTLVAEKEGFTATETPITAYEAEGIEIVLAEDGPFECVLSELPEPSALKENQKLPNPFAFFDGTEITKKSQWPCLRQEILNMAYKYMYGPMPPFEAPDVEIEGTVSGSGVTAKISYNGKTETMNFGTSGSGDILLISMGGAGIGPGGNYPHRTLNVNNGTPGSWGGVCKKLFGMDPCGEIALGWGCNILCRAIADDPDGGIDTNKIMTTGCSNTAKAAFLCGVFCEGIDLTVPVESGGFGAASPRVAEYLYKGPGPWNCGDPPQGLWSPDFGSQWLAGPYMDPNVAKWVIQGNSGNVYKLPYDHHMLMACVAPRALCVCSNGNGRNSWCHLNGTGSAVAAWAAEPVFNALGVPDNIAFSIPNSYSHCMGAQGAHGSLVNEFFKRVFDGDENAKTDVMNIPANNVQLDPAEWKSVWVDWDMEKTLE